MTYQPERLLALLLAATCGGFLAFKFALLGRSNINWDEFLYLSNVYQLSRGELTLFLQGAYSHLFVWLTTWPGDEVAQIVAARGLMMVLLVGAVVLIWLLAGRWLAGPARWIPVLVFVSSLPVLKHGASFRADSMLVFLLLAGITLLAARHRKPATDYVAGAIFGAAFALTVKTVLFLPLVAVLLLAREGQSATSGGENRDAPWRGMLRVGLASAAVAVLLLIAHRAVLPPVPPEVHVAQGSQIVGKAVLDVPWFPRWAVLEGLYHLQPLLWMLIGVGAMLAFARKQMGLTAMILSMLPIVFYRNAFPYFFVVMLAPASILAGFAVQEVATYLSGRFGRTLGLVMVVGVCLGLVKQGAAAGSWIDWDGQLAQRDLVTAVHQIFPEPVAYVDRCGMVSSFRKANFFMSTWGMEAYRERGVPFMPSSIERARPAFVLVNTEMLDPARRAPRGLLSEDYDLIQQFYVPYWGPLRVAGAQANLRGAETEAISLPFPGRYRLVSSEPVMIEDVERAPGEVVDVKARAVSMRLLAGNDEGSATVTLVLDAAKPPPTRGFSGQPLFEPL